jgi:hypothetical protein
VAELVDALDSKSSSARSAGSIPARGTSLRCLAATAGKPRAILSQRSSEGCPAKPFGEAGRDTVRTKRSAAAQDRGEACPAKLEERRRTCFAATLGAAIPILSSQSVEGCPAQLFPIRRRRIDARYCSEIRGRMLPIPALEPPPRGAAAPSICGVTTDPPFGPPVGAATAGAPAIFSSRIPSIDWGRQRL